MSKKAGDSIILTDKKMFNNHYQNLKKSSQYTSDGTNCYFPYFFS